MTSGIKNTLKSAAGLSALATASGLLGAPTADAQCGPNYRDLRFQDVTKSILFTDRIVDNEGRPNTFFQVSVTPDFESTRRPIAIRGGDLNRAPRNRNGGDSSDLTLSFRNNSVDNRFVTVDPSFFVTRFANPEGYLDAGYATPGVRIFTKGQDGGTGGEGGLFVEGQPGGRGGDGGNICSDFENYRIFLHGTDTYGILGVSQGGLGGAGGGVALGIGADGGQAGGAGNGGDVTLNLDRNTYVQAADAGVGVLAQSLGGAGGIGGASSDGIGDTAGGAAAAGGSGGDVRVVNRGTVLTNGDGGNGVIVQSIAGRGGAGGSAVGLFGIVGGDGGGGGSAGNLSARNEGTVRTNGDGAFGYLMQSIGGGGGASGSATGFTAIGGGGTSGGDAGESIAFYNSGLVLTRGDNASAVVLQSVGGGGGAGGNATGAIAVGGRAGSAGDGGYIQINLDTLAPTDGNQSRGITTQGVGSVGVLAQSIGGGGGAGGSSAGLGAIGGQGGAAGDGGRIELIRDAGNRPGTVRTSGDSAAGLVIQSIGGGGGHGGSASAAAFSLGASGASGGHGGEILADPSRSGQFRGILLDIETTGENSPGAIFQSIGGGGGNGGTSATTGFAAGASIGGSGADGGSGGRVDLFFGDDIGNTDTRIVTHGNNSVGVLGQSIGGGGGNGGSALSAIVGTGKTISISIGGNGADGGVGNDSEIRNFTDITTFGANSGGIVTQSIGGGGGNGGSSVAASGSIGDGFNANLALGGSGASGGVGGAVVLSNNRNVITHGSNSHALTGQSIGGGGGNGGDALTFGAQASPNANLSLGVTVGGSGGSGGIAQRVRVEARGGSITFGDRSYAVLAQSIGGGGGSGGSAVSTSAGVSGSAGTLSLQMALGGSGGSGGQGGLVHVFNLGGTRTDGDLAHAIVAQSIGGGGGAGGFAGTGAVAISARGGAGSALASIGGTGGSGGVAGDVEVIVDGPTSTKGAGSNAVLAQSIGGGGGAGGVSLSASASGAGSVSGNAGIAIGGDGAGGGVAGDVDIVLRDAVETQGDNSAGLVAQSIGGGGGNGGFAARGSLAVALNSSPAASVGVSLGGQGGNGGDAREVRITGDKPGSSIVTFGDNAAGAIAQSIGGGGGNGGSAITGGLSFSGGNAGNIGFSLGGNGGTGGDGGVVENRNVDFNRNFSGQSYGSSIVWRQNITTTTYGNNSHGLLAQTVGGGGGNGGFALSGGLAISGNTAANLNVSLGGNGGSGGDALTGSYIGARGRVITHGDGSTGLLAQSIGGGGGNGGYSISGAITGGPSQAASVNIALGGQAGTGGNAFGSNIDVFHSVITHGNGSHGAHVQSLGGGGGNAGFAAALGVGGGGRSISGSIALGRNGGNGGDSSEASIGSNQFGQPARPGDLNLTTFGDGSHAVFAQSIGGGGGAASFGLAGTADAGNSTAFGLPFAIGGSGSSGGQGRRATINNNSLIFTEGQNSYGLFAQSIGGGGGAASQSISLAASATFSGSTPTSAGLSATIGGNDGGSGGRSGEVNILNDGPVNTKGNGSIGVFGQSTGGGGGVGTFAAALSGNFGGSGSFPTYAAALGGDGGTGGISGIVDISSSGPISTRGANAHALMGQATGGGGGHGGFALAFSGTGGTTGLSTSLSAALGGDGGSGGNADRVDMTNSGDLFTLGDAATGLIAQSIGGGGGNAGYAMSGSLAGGAPKNNASLAFSMGGAGGSGGTAGSITVNSSGEITTVGGYSRGILAQSVGGGGGNAGAAYSGAVGFGKQVQAASIALGGSGGNGGFGNSVSVTNSGNIVTGATVVMESGDDGMEDMVDSDRSALARAQGGAVGILAQSIGGGGGTGGLAASLTGTVGTNTDRATTFNLGLGAGLARPETGGGSASVGGDGGTGGTSGQVWVVNSGEITTVHDDSHGIHGQSIGGGGGSGGMSIAGAFGAQRSVNIALALGGAGAEGGNAFRSRLTNSGDINTYGDQSHGLFLQSIGGGGGYAGTSGAMSFGATDSTNLSLSLGASGGQGGSGGRIDLVGDGRVETRGEGAHAVAVQSIGGGGGMGGIAGLHDELFADLGLGGVNPSGAGSAGQRTRNLSLAFGGSGGSGAAGGQIFLIQREDIVTHGANSYGILAQSIGGGGGAGGFATAVGAEAGTTNGTVSLNFAMGGNGGSGADGGFVQIGNTADLTTFGDGATGFVVQSIGGGGGYGAAARGEFYSFTNPASKPSSFQSAVALGGQGGVAGNGGTARAFKDGGTVMTFGHAAHGILAQSIGGGGGVGGQAAIEGINLASLVGAASIPTSLDVALGGSGGASGDGGTVWVRLAEGGATVGNQSSVVYAQSIGGGGGTGGAASTGTTGAMITGGQGSEGNGGTLTVDHSDGLLLTMGDRSHGIFAQSVGGGGGEATDLLVADSAETAEDLTALMASLASTGSSDAVRGDILSGASGFLNGRVSQPAIDLTLGGTASTGDGGFVDINSSGAIEVQGAGSYGVFGQSIGGGGGVAGTGLLGLVDEISISPVVELIGLTEAGDDLITIDRTRGDGGNVDIDRTGDIRAFGVGSMGIVAQSVGGGGGFAGSFPLGIQDYGSIARGANPSRIGGNGDGGDITVDSTGDIVLTGGGSIGILAQSIAGGGGVISGDAGLASFGSLYGEGLAGTVTINSTGDIVASGVNGVGIFAQSDGRDGDGRIEVFSRGTVIGGAGFGAAAILDGGGSNEIRLRRSSDEDYVWADSGDVLIALSGSNLLVNENRIFGDVTFGGGRDRVDNRRQFVGALNLGAGNNLLTNREGAVFDGVINGTGAEIRNFGQMFAEVNLGAQNDVITNAAGALFSADADFGAGNDSLTNEGTLTGDYDFGDGIDTFINENMAVSNIETNGTVNPLTVTLGAGNDVAINEALGVLDGELSFGIGNDSFNNHGMANVTLSMGDGIDTIMNAENAIMIADVDTGTGTDTFTNEGEVAGKVSMGSGNDTFDNRGRAELSLLAMGNGTNVVANRADAVMIADVTGGVNRDRYFNFGTFQGNIDLGAGGDAFNNIGWTELSTLSLGNGNNTVSNSETGVMFASIIGGGDDDSFTNEGYFEGDINLGGGANQITNSGTLFLLSSTRTPIGSAPDAAALAYANGSTSVVDVRSEGLSAPLVSVETKEVAAPMAVSATASVAPPLAGDASSHRSRTELASPSSVFSGLDGMATGKPSDQASNFAASGVFIATKSDLESPAPTGETINAEAAIDDTAEFVAPSLVPAVFEEPSTSPNNEFITPSVPQPFSDGLSMTGMLGVQPILAEVPGTSPQSFVWTADVVNTGMISLGSGSVGDHLTIDGSLTGDGGMFVFDAVAENGALVQSDRVTITGDVAGTTLIDLNTEFDEPFQTAGGVALIEVGGDASTATFVLNPDDFQQGAFGLELSVEGGALNLNAEVLDQVVLYNTALTSQHLAWQAGMDALLVRVNDLQSGADIGKSRDHGNGVRSWITVYREQGDAAPAAEQYQSDFDFDRFGVTLGVEKSFGAATLGAFLGKAQHETDLIDRRAGQSLDSDTFGVYGALGLDNGLSASMILKADPFDVSFSAPDMNVRQSTDGFTFGAGATLAYTYDINADWQVTPRLSASYSNTDFDAFTDERGVDVRADVYEVTTLGGGLHLKGPEFLGGRSFADVGLSRTTSPAPEARILAEGSLISASLEGEQVNWQLGSVWAIDDTLSLTAFVSGADSDFEGSTSVGLDFAWTF